MTKNKVQKDNNWKNVQIGKLLDYEQPTNYIVSSTDYSDEYKIPVLTAGKSFVLGYTNESEGVFSKEKLPVIIFDDFTTANKFVDFPFKVKSSAMKILKNKDEKISDIKFVFGWMMVHPFTVGQHKRNYLSEYQYLDVLLPPLPEQKRIVGVLEVWDRGIEMLERKIVVKENIKKGLLQRMMNCELSIVNEGGKKKKVFAPKLRLPGFDGPWEEKKLGEVVEFWNGKGHEKDISKNGKYIVVNSKFISSDGLIKKFSNEQKTPLRKGDVVMVMSDVPNGKAIAKTFLIDEDKKYTLNQRIGGFKSEKVQSMFLQNLLNRNRYFLSFDDGVSQTNLRKDDILACKLIFPSFKEQKAIAEVLTTADEEIEALRKKLDVWKEQKRFLLNNLVTGNIRVPE